MSELPPLRGDEDELIRSYTPVLERRLAWAVNTSAANPEDAIAFAWMVFLRRQPDRDGAWRPTWRSRWIGATATTPRSPAAPTTQRRWAAVREALP
jgi:hypothetical protein